MLFMLQGNASMRLEQKEKKLFAVKSGGIPDVICPY